MTKSLQDRIQLLENIVFNDENSLQKRVQRLEEAVLGVNLQNQVIQEDNRNLIHKYTLNTCIITMFASLALGVLVNVMLIHQEKVKNPEVKKEIQANNMKSLPKFKFDR